MSKPVEIPLIFKKRSNSLGNTTPKKESENLSVPCNTPVKAHEILLDKTHHDHNNHNNNNDAQCNFKIDWLKLILNDLSNNKEKNSFQ